MREQVNLLKLFLEIDEAIRRIERSFNGIKEPDDFIRDDDGLDRLDGINDEEYIVRLIKKVITVSLETVKIVKGLPDLGLPKD